MSHKGRIRSKSDSPEQAGSQNGHSTFGKVFGKFLVSVKQEFHLGMDVPLPVRNDHRAGQLDDSGQQSSQRRTLHTHGGDSKGSINKNGIEHNVDTHCGRADRRRCLCMSADFHDNQITLGNSGEQIGKTGNPQIVYTVFHQHTFVGKNQHQIFSAKNTGSKKCHGHQSTKPQCHTENFIQCLHIPFSPILGTQNA